MFQTKFYLLYIYIFHRNLERNRIIDLNSVIGELTNLKQL